MLIIGFKQIKKNRREKEKKNSFFANLSILCNKTKLLLIILCEYRAMKSKIIYCDDDDKNLMIRMKSNT